MATQHADEQGMQPRQQICLGPACQTAAQGRSADLILGRGQTAPRRALAQEAPQGCNHTDGVGRRVPRSASGLRATGVDDCGDELKESETQCCYP